MSYIIVLKKEHAEMLRDVVDEWYSINSDQLNDNGIKTDQEIESFKEFMKLHKLIYSQLVYQGINPLRGEIAKHE